MKSSIFPGAPVALASGALFGTSTPMAKLLFGGDVDPWLLAGVIYLGSGLGLGLVHLGRRGLGQSAAEAPLRRSGLPWLSLVVVSGGLIGPVLLLLGLARTAASSAALLNLTRKLSSADPVQIAAIKGVVAGAVNLALAFSHGAHMPDLACVAGAAIVGFFGYGVSLVLFVLALRLTGCCPPLYRAAGRDIAVILTTRRSSAADLAPVRLAGRGPACGLVALGGLGAGALVRVKAWAPWP